MKYRARAVKLRWQFFAAAVFVQILSAAVMIASVLIALEQVERGAQGRFPDPLIRELSHSMVTTTVFAIAGGIVVGILVSLWLALTMTNVYADAFDEMIEVAHSMSGGSYDRRVEDPELGPEISSLVGSFNEMAIKLDETEVSRRRMLTDLAHEMRTPIASIDMLLEGIEDGLVEVNQPTIDLLRMQCQRLRRLTDDVRDVSAAEEGRLDLTMTRCDLRDIVTGVPMLYTERFRAKHVTLQVDQVPAEELPVDIDVDRIHQVVTNLLNNALRHSGDDGTVRLVIDRHDDMARLRVIDDGEGIPAEHLVRVMERFYRVDTARSRGQGGTGVGLAICRAIAFHHHGSLTISSEGAGKGATGTLLLPLAP